MCMLSSSTAVPQGLGMPLSNSEQHLQLHAASSASCMSLRGSCEGRNNGELPLSCCRRCSAQGAAPVDLLPQLPCTCCTGCRACVPLQHSHDQQLEDPPDQAAAQRCLMSSLLPGWRRRGLRPRLAPALDFHPARCHHLQARCCMVVPAEAPMGGSLRGSSQPSPTHWPRSLALKLHVESQTHDSFEGPGHLLTQHSSFAGPPGKVSTLLVRTPRPCLSLRQQPDMKGPGQLTDGTPEGQLLACWPSIRQITQEEGPGLLLPHHLQLGGPLRWVVTDKP